MSFPTYRYDGDVAAMRGSSRTYRADGDVAAIRGSSRTYRVDGDVAARHNSSRTYGHGEDILAIHSIQRIDDQDELPPIIISVMSPQYIEREPRPRSVSRHRADTDSEASASTKQSKRSTKVILVYPKVEESESVWTPFGILGKKKSKR
jgi:hypothetical protein